METSDILKGNKVIAEFVDVRHEAIGRNFGNPDRRNHYVYDFNDPSKRDIEAIPDYHASWDWLIPVVGMCKEKYAEINTILRERLDYEALSEGAELLTRIFASLASLDRDIIFSLCVEFIEWYNEKNK